MTKQYAERDAMALDEAGGYYMRHVVAMTGEQLHSKGDIAAELGWRDMKIVALQKQNEINEALLYAMRQDMRESREKMEAMLGENVALKAGADKCYDVITSIHNTYGWSVSEDGESETAVIDLESALFVLNENIIDIKTAATDAIAKELRAEGVDRFGEFLAEPIDGESQFKHVCGLASHFAETLRAGNVEGGE